MKQFKLIDTLMGWLVFAVAAFTYCTTVEPTASFWDCPEFITTAYKLEVGHPPGAPFFMLTGNLFTQFTSDPTQVAYMVNIMSALFSALCILFLFWSITHLARKLVGTNGQVTTLAQLIAVEASGAVGALIYTFSDTFWYSAVEGEVYAYSSLFTALVFWLILRWEDHADEPHSDRWLVLIAYLTGLSIGVHLLNLLCLPAIVLVFYYRKFPNANLKGSIVALLVSFILIAVVLYGIVPGIVKMGGWFELLFVNSMGFSFNTGLFVYIFLLITAVIWAIWESTVQRNRKRMAASYAISVGLLGIPFYGHGWSSALIGIVVLAVVVAALLRRVTKGYWVSARLMNTSLLCMLMIIVGYSSYAVIVIRSTANTPMDQNSPEDIFTLGTYLGREQYGDRPLLYGKTYNSQVKYKPEGNACVPQSKKGAPVYQRQEKKNASEPDRYQLVRHNIDYIYDQNMLFPRMHSDIDDHKKAYEEWMGGIKGKLYTYPMSDQCRSGQQVKIPTMLENLKFFFSYQVNFMYWRYFMWNFAGRQNDIQGHGEAEHGNWLTGISFIDNLMLGDQSKMPTELKENKGHNVYYALPLLLGLLGLFWQVDRGSRGTKEESNDVNEGVKQFWVVFFLFFMTGLAIVVYLNQTPLQPRERDYAYAGSFYAYAIWCGLGVAALAQWLGKLGKNETLGALLACTAFLVPLQMASQNWDDHDRSDRYTCRDFGRNYLQSLSQTGNPIIFTNGDNDTFPLWYAQETEGFRTDARVCNLSYLQTDWYIDQMKRPAYDSPSVPIDWKRIQYVSGTREGVRVEPDALKTVLDNIKQMNDNPEVVTEALGENPYELKNIMEKWILSDNPMMQIIPTDSIVVPIDKEAVRRSGMMIAGDSIPDYMVLSLKGRGAVYKSELMMYEMLRQCNWERPMYMAVTVGPSNEGALGKYFVQEGLANRITPFDTSKTGGSIDTERMYDNLMNRFAFGGINNPDIYLDETVMRMCYTHRRMFAQLGTALLLEGKLDKAKKLMEKAEQEIPSTTVPHNWQSGSLQLADVWSAVGEARKAEVICEQVLRNSEEYLTYYLQQTGRYAQSSIRNCVFRLQEMRDAMDILFDVNEKEAEKWAQRYGELQSQVLMKYPALRAPAQ